MTKKEFIELIKDVPDDWDIVFRTNSERLDVCLPLREEYITIEQQCLNVFHKNADWTKIFPRDKGVLEFKKAIVLEAIPYEHLEEKYRIHITI